MNHATYIERRDRIGHYFDRTAVDAWKAFATQQKVSRIRATVRQGRAEMRAAILSMLPADLAGWRILDAGCGAGALAVELARRGADVLAVDLSEELVRFAAAQAPAVPGPGRVEFVAGDMLSASFGRFDAVVSMDSLIHYAPVDAVAALATLAGRTARQIVFTFAPRTPLLAMMHGVGKLFPRSDRSPAIEPVAPAALVARIGRTRGLEDWECGRTARVHRGFYISQALEVNRG